MRLLRGSYLGEGPGENREIRDPTLEGEVSSEGGFWGYQPSEYEHEGQGKDDDELGKPVACAQKPYVKA